MASNPEEAIPLATSTPETSATQNKCTRGEMQVADVFLFGVPAVMQLVVAGVIYDSNKKNYWDCYEPNRPGTDGCIDGGTYACVAPWLPTMLVWIATVLVLRSAIAGIHWNCSEWYTYCDIRGQISPPYVIALCFLTLELLAAAYYSFTLLAFCIGSDYITQAPLSTRTGRCCCDFWDSAGDVQAESPLIMAGMAAAIIIFGAGHILASERAEEKQGSSAWAAI